MADTSERRQRDPARVTLKNVRLSFASLFKAKPFGGAGRGGDDGGEPKFQGNFLLDPTTKSGKANIAKVEAAIDHAIENHNWGGKAPKFAETKLPLRDGDNVDYDGYEGMMYVSSNNAKRPKVFDQDNEEVTHESDDGAPYSGCYVDAIVRVWAQDNKWGKRINASLEAVRFREDGDAFGAAPVDADDFDDDDDDPPARSKRDRDDDRGGRSSRRDDDDEKPSRPRRDDDERPRRSSRDEDDERPSRRSRDEDDERPSRRSRDEDDERPSRRSRDDDDRPSRRGRDEDDEDRPRQRRSRDDDERPSRSRRRDDDDVV